MGWSRHAIMMLGVLVLLVAAAARAEPPVAVLDPEAKELVEVYRDEVPVSGRVIAGLSLAGVPLSTELALVPAGKAAGGKVCVQVLSRDGRYWAQNTFVVPPGDLDGPVGLQYPSRYLDLLSRAETDDLAILSYLGPCGAAAERQYVLSSRAPFSRRDAALLIFVNSGRTDTYAAIVNRPERTRPQKCRPITEGRRTGYDTVCELGLNEGDRSLEELRVKVYRRKYEKNLAPVDLVIRMPP